MSAPRGGPGPSSPAPTFDADVARALTETLSGRRPAMEAFLAEIVAIESPSTEPDLQRPVLEAFAHRLQPLGFRVRLRPGHTSGGMLYASSPARPSQAPTQLLLGHADTVWPVGTLAEMPVEIDGDVMRGPGIYDMKAGLAMALFALETITELGLRPSVWPVMLINTDEEIGSHESGPTIRRLAPNMDRVFVLEPSLTPAGKLKTARKGVGRFTVTAQGRAAHAGLNPEEGISAILELSHVIQELFALNDPTAGITVNVGQIDGGMRANVVAPESRAVIDVRVPTRADAERIATAIYALRPTVPGVELLIEGRVGRPPMEPTPRNRALWHLAREAGRSLGLALEEGAAGGASDGNTTSQYTATLDGAGAVGDGAHALHEHIRLPELMERSALLALLLLTPPLGHGEGPAANNGKAGP